MTDREMLGVRLPSQLKDEVDLEGRPNQEVVEAALRQYLGVGDRSRLEMRLEHARKMREMEVEKRDAHEAEVDRLDEEIGALTSRLDELEAAAKSYAERIDEILDEMVETGMHVDPGHGAVEDLVEEPHRPADQVLDDLRDRAEELHLGLPDRQFEAKDGGRR